MRRFSPKLTRALLTTAVALPLTAALPIPAFAADAGTYRPGAAYQSVPASAPSTCESQCSGDAQCRSWNYIKISKSAQGVCEFNSDVVSPVPSSISVSGENNSSHSFASVVQGSTNTVRVGSPTITQPKATVSRPSASRRVVTQPVPQKIQPRSSNFAHRQAHPQSRQPQNTQHQNRQHQNTQHLSLSEQQRRQTARTQSAPRSAARPQFQHSLEDGVSAAPRTHNPAKAYPNAVNPQTVYERAQRAATTPPRPAPPNYSQADPRLMQRLKQASAQPDLNTNYRANPANRRTGPTPPRRSNAAPISQNAPRHNSGQSSGQNPGQNLGGLSAPPNVPPLNPADQRAFGRAPQQQARPVNQAQAMRPQRPQVPQQPQQPPRHVSIPSELSPRPMGSAQNNLFGSLYDDVKVPRPLDPAIAADPNAPIPTVSSVPTSQIHSAPLPPAR